MVLRLTLGLFAGLLMASELQAQVPGIVRTDTLGDPLPDGAVARLGTRRFKHDNFTNQFQGGFGRGNVVTAVTKAVFSPDGKKIASLGQNNLRLWDAETGKEWAGPWNGVVGTGSAFSLGTISAFSQSGDVLATSRTFVQQGVVSSEVTLWDVAGAKKLRTIEVDNQIQALTFADQDKTVVCAGQGRVRWLDAVTGKELRTWLPFPEGQQPAKAPGKTNNQVYSYVFSADAKLLAAGVRVLKKADEKDKDEKGGFAILSSLEVVAFDLAAQKMTWRAKSKPGSTTNQPQVTFSGDGKRAALVFGRDQIEIRDAVSGKLVAMPTLEANAAKGLSGALALSHDGKTVALADNESRVMLWKPDDPTGAIRKVVGRLGTNPNAYLTRSLAFSSDGKRILVAVNTDLQLYDTDSLKEVMPFDGHRSGVDNVAFSADGKRLMTNSGQAVLLNNLNTDTNEVITWDTASWKQLRSFSAQAPSWPNVGVVSSDRTYFVGKTGQDRFQLYDMASGKLLGRFMVPGNQSKQSAMSFSSFSPNGKFFVVAGNDGRGHGTGRLYAVPSCKLLCELPGLDDTYLPYVWDIGFAAAGRLLAFSTDEQLVALNKFGDGRIHIIETASGKVIQRLGKARDLREDQGIDFNDLLEFLGAEFSIAPDNKTLASWNPRDNVVRLWDLGTGKERMQMLANDLRNLPLAFAWSPDGRTLAVSGLAERGTIQLWEVAARKVRRVLVGHDGDVRAMAFSPDGKLLASGSADTTVLVWDVWGWAQSQP